MSDQQSQQNWFRVAIVTAVIGGVVQVIVNHFDAIASWLGRTIIHIHVPSVGNSSWANAINILSAAAAILGAIFAILQRLPRAVIYRPPKPPNK